MLRIPLAALLLALGARGQDPLGGAYFDGGGAQAPPQPMSPPGMMAPQGVAPAGGGGGGFGRSVMMLGLGAGCMKAYDMYSYGQKQKQHEQQLATVSQQFALKRGEVARLETAARQCQYQVRELQQALYESEAEALQRDYEEFKAPDADGDERISIYEFGAYIANYMKAYPHIPEEDYPTFEDFDKNRRARRPFRHRFLDARRGIGLRPVQFRAPAVKERRRILGARRGMARFTVAQATAP